MRTLQTLPVASNGVRALLSHTQSEARELGLLSAGSNALICSRHLSVCSTHVALDSTLSRAPNSCSKFAKAASCCRDRLGGTSSRSDRFASSQLRFVRRCSVGGGADSVSSIGSCSSSDSSSGRARRNVGSRLNSSCSAVCHSCHVTRAYVQCWMTCAVGSGRARALTRGAWPPASDASRLPACPRAASTCPLRE